MMNIHTHPLPTHGNTPSNLTLTYFEWNVKTKKGLQFNTEPTCRTQIILRFKSNYHKRKNFRGHNISWVKFSWVRVAHRNYCC